MAKLKFIDFRLRPPTQTYQSMFPPPLVKSMHKRFGFGNPTASYTEGSVSRLIQEMDEVNISVGVVMGRANLATSIPNDEVAQFQKDYPNRFLGFAGIDPMRVVQKKPLDELERCVKELGLKGASIDHCWMVGNFLDHIGLYPDDRRLYPIYERCAGLGVPVSLFTGALAGEDFSYTDPSRMIRVARQFRNLKIVLPHGCYPHVTGILGAAFRCENLFICPDMYMFMAGATPYMEAINSDALNDQMLFGTAYPLFPLKETVERTLKLGLKDEGLEKYAFRNAARLLGLGG